MSLIYKTDAVVLQARRYSESSKIVTLYTRDRGKVGVMARGAMQPKNRFGSALQHMAIVSTTVYHKEGRELQTVSAAETTVRLGHLFSDLDAMSAGLSVIELVNAVMHDAETNEPVFDLLCQTLQALNDPVTSPPVLVVWFSVRLAEHIGYAITPGRCGVCGEPVEAYAGRIGFSMPVGAPLCQAHSFDDERGISAGAFGMLNDLCKIFSATEAGALRVGAPLTTELNRIVTSFIQYHVQGLRRLKTRDVALQILQK